MKNFTPSAAADAPTTAAMRGNEFASSGRNCAAGTDEAIYLCRCVLRKKTVILFVSVSAVACLILTGCRSQAYDKPAALLDSVKIVLQVKLNELKKAEANIQLRGYSKYDLYKQFLSSNLKDTIAHAEAAALQQFLNSGEIIRQYNNSKSELISQTELSIAQLQKLSADLKQNNLGATQTQQFYVNEKEHADKLVQVIEKNITAVNIALMNYKNSTARTEELIRQINHGQLPTVVADSTAP